MTSDIHQEMRKGFAQNVTMNHSVSLKGLLFELKHNWREIIKRNGIHRLNNLQEPILK